MNDDLIERLWRESSEEEPMSHEQLIGALEPRVERSARTLQTYAWTYVLIQLSTLLLAGANLVAYRSNPVMLGVESGIAVAALAFAAYGVRIHGEVRRLERMDETLATALRRRLAFYTSNATTWMWVATFSLVVFSFALNTFIDNANGEFRINKPLVFVGVQVAMVAVLVTSFRMTHEPILRELRAVLADLEAQVLDKTPTVDVERERWTKWRVALVALLTAMLALGAWLAWKA